MIEAGSTLSYRGVLCLHCGKPISLTMEVAAVTVVAEGEARPAAKRPVVLWCPSCEKEAPYLRSEILDFDGEPPSPHWLGRPIVGKEKKKRARVAAA